jgi:hypothetical protein
MLRLTLPVSVMLSGCVWLVPTGTFPKPKADGTTAICCACAVDGKERKKKTETKRSGAQGLTKPKPVTVHTYACAP